MLPYFLRLEDGDGDGKCDRRSVFAESEMMPQGSMWLDGSLYVAAAPVIWKLTDTDDDGVADQRPRTRRPCIVLKIALEICPKRIGWMLISIETRLWTEVKKMVTTIVKKVALPEL